MKKPLIAPTDAPMPSPAKHIRTWLQRESVVCSAMITLTSESTAPQERSNPPIRNTTVWPMAAKARGPVLDDRKLISK